MGVGEADAGREGGGVNAEAPDTPSPEALSDEADCKCPVCCLCWELFIVRDERAVMTGEVSADVPRGTLR
jgi:hypothetical protein